MANGNNAKIGATEVLVWADLTPAGTAAAAKIAKERGYDDRHVRALKYAQKLAAAFEPVQMTVWMAKIGAPLGTARRILLRLAVDGIVSLHGLDDPATPDAVRQYVADHREADEPEPETEAAA